MTSRPLPCLLGALVLLLPNVSHAADGPPWPAPDALSGPVAEDGAGDAAVIVSVVPTDPTRAVAPAWTKWMARRGVPGANVFALSEQAATVEAIAEKTRIAAKAVRADGKLWLIYSGQASPFRDTLDLKTANRPMGLVQWSQWAERDSKGQTVVVVDSDNLTFPLQNAPKPTAGVTIVLGGKDKVVAAPLADSPSLAYLVLGALYGWADINRNREVTSLELQQWLLKVHGCGCHNSVIAPPKPLTLVHLDTAVAHALRDVTGTGGLGISGSGMGGGGVGDGTIGLGSLGTIGRGAGSGGGSGYGRGVGAPAPKKPPAPVERFPTLLAPDQVAVGTTFALEVSLTQAKVVADVKVAQGQATAEGKLKLELDNSPAPWTIDVAVAAPGFAVLGSNLGKLTLPADGDSTPALFQLRPRPTVQGKSPEVFATLWFKGRFLAKVSKPIVVGAPAPVALRDAPDAPAAPAAAPPPVAKPAAVQGVAATVAATESVADLTVWMLQGGDPARPDEAQILIQSPHLQPVAGEHRVAVDLGQRLDAQYAQFVRRSQRGAEALGAGPAKPDQAREDTALLLRGFGKELYANSAPLLFKQALATLQAQLGPKLQSIQIYTNSPQLPWELLAVPKPASDEVEFLGVQYRVARWHVTAATQVLMRPAQLVEVAGVYVVAPSYDGAAALPAQDAELKAIAAASGGRYHKTAGDFAAMQSLVAGGQETSVGIVHFAGHGQAAAQENSVAPQFTIRLADRSLPLLAWKGLAGRWGGAHPLVFFNACEVGRSEKTAGFVDGWGPAVLETGASGYIGGLWPLGDKAAADAASRFYASAVAGAHVPVAEAVRQIRAAFATTGDPTYLAYVFYGDAGMALGAPEVAADHHPLQLSIQPVQVQGNLAPDIVTRVVRRHLNELLFCVEREAARNPNQMGRVTLQLVISPNGTVANSVVQQTTAAKPEAGLCMAQRARMWQFPQPESGIVMVNLAVLVGP